MVRFENVPAEKNLARHRIVRHDEWQKRVIESMCRVQPAIYFHQNHTVQWAVYKLWQAERLMVRLE